MKLVYRIFSYIFLVLYIGLSQNVESSNLNDIMTLELKTSFVENYMWRGFDLLPNNDSAFQPDLYLEFINIGIYVGVWGSFAFDSIWDIWDEWDYYIGSFKSFNENTKYAYDIDFSYTYFDFPNQSKYLNTQEVAVGVKLPNLFSIDNIKIKPFSTLYYSFPVHKNELDQKGFWLKMGAEMELPFNFSNSDNMKLLIESFLNDGGASFQVDKGFSHIHFMLVIPFEVKGFKFKPSIHYQYTIEDTVNSEDEFWGEISIIKTLL